MKLDDIAKKNWREFVSCGRQPGSGETGEPGWCPLTSSGEREAVVDSACGVFAGTPRGYDTGEASKKKSERKIV